MTAVIPPRQPRMELLFEARVRLGSLAMVGAYADGHERGMLEMLGGEFEGPGLRGRILPSTKDWPVYFGNGVRLTDVEYVYVTDDGAHLFVTIRGFRYDIARMTGSLLDAESVQPAPNPHRVHVFIQAPERSRYEWLSHNVFIGVGGQGGIDQPARTARLDVYRVL